jgi:hypothetical protein
VSRDGRNIGFDHVIASGERNGMRFEVELDLTDPQRPQCLSVSMMPAGESAGVDATVTASILDAIARDAAARASTFVRNPTFRT